MENQEKNFQGNSNKNGISKKTKIILASGAAVLVLAAGIITCAFVANKKDDKTAETKPAEVTTVSEDAAITQNDDKKVEEKLAPAADKKTATPNDKKPAPKGGAAPADKKDPVLTQKAEAAKKAMENLPREKQERLANDAKSYAEKIRDAAKNGKPDKATLDELEKDAEKLISEYPKEAQEMFKELQKKVAEEASKK